MLCLKATQGKQLSVGPWAFDVPPLHSSKAELLGAFVGLGDLDLDDAF